MKPLFLLLLALSAHCFASEAQDRCIEQTSSACIEKCEANLGPNCNDLCQENAKNECLQAGE